ncbi:MAG TPA: hypothetical protein VKT17_02600, partial [Acidobacteriota bacterium]|nr:hypothetical protein [Acidobacteriota bacterium]
MPDSEALTTLKSTIAKYLQESFGGFLRDQNDNFILQAGSARIIIAPVDWVDGQTLVKVIAPVNMGGGPADELAKFLVAE